MKEFTAVKRAAVIVKFIDVALLCVCLCVYMCVYMYVCLSVCLSILYVSVPVCVQQMGTLHTYIHPHLYTYVHTTRLFFHSTWQS